MSRGPGSAVCLSALGVRVAISAEPEVADALRTAWSSCLTRFDGDAELVVAADEVRARTGAGSTGELLQRITEVVTRGAIELRAGELLMLHACAVADVRSGAVAVFVGPSGMGKTTLAATLARRWAYVSDETVAVARDGQVIPYPKPLSILCGERGHKRQVSPGELGLAPASGALRVARVVLLDRAPSGDVGVSGIAVVPGVALLAEHTSYLTALDRPLTRVATVLNEAAGLHRVRYAEADQLVPLVEQWWGDAR